MCVHTSAEATHIATLEGRTMVEYTVAKAADETNQIDGNIYVGRIQNVLPGMELAFVDIGIPKNAVLYRGDISFDMDDVEGTSSNDKRIEQMIKSGQTIICQVTKNAIGAKGARLTQEVSLPGRFAVLVPNSSTIGISKRLPDGERRRLRKIIDDVKPERHGIIIRTAAEGVTADDLARDVSSLADKWAAIEAEVAKSNQPRLVYRDLDLAVRVLREELNDDYRGVLIDDQVLFEKVREYVMAVNPELADRIEYYDRASEELPLFERYFVHEQLHRALDRKVFLPSGGSLIIERTEALTVVDVNTGKNVGTTNLEETVFRNNLEAAEEVARQLRLRDIGGIIVIDFIDMESKVNREAVASALRQALSRDKTRTQVFDISELGLVEMTRKRVNEGLLESVSKVCTVCDGRGFVVETGL
jgi:ribonuclease E